jgi:hypothetical protein
VGAAQLQLGNFSEAQRLLDTAEQAMADVTAHSAWRSRPLLELSLAELAWERGDAAGAMSPALSAEALTEADAEVTWKLLALETSMRMAARVRDWTLAQARLDAGSSLLESGGAAGPMAVLDDRCGRS